MEETRLSFKEQMLRHEKELIRQALIEENGSVTKAAALLSLDHQALCYLINHHHPDLLTLRSPIRKRRRSSIK